jgi:hypothetical protein
MNKVEVQLLSTAETTTICLRNPLPTDILWPPGLVIALYRLRQVLQNLIKNAEDAHANNIVVKLDREPSSAGYLRLVVTDDGDVFRGGGSSGLGHKLIRRVIASLRAMGYEESSFECARAGSIGHLKEFVLLLPTSAAQAKVR